jgi:hypothetical protein
MSDNVNILNLKVEYFDQLSEFLQSMTGGQYSSTLWIDRFNYWWVDNPNAKEIGRYGRVIFNNSNEIKGFLGFVPIPYKYNDTNIISAGFTSWFVDEDFRGKSLQLLRSLLKEPNIELFFDTTPSDKAVQIFSALKFNLIDREWHNKLNLKPINFDLLVEYYSYRKLSSRKLSLIFIIFFKLIPVQKLFNIFYMRLSTKNEYEVRKMTNFTETHTKIWDEVNKDSLLYANRSQENASWLFWGSKHLSDSRVCMEILKNKKLIGYCIFDICKRQMLDREVCFYQLKEWAVCDNNKKSHQELLFSIINHARKNKKVAAVNIEPFSNDIICNIMDFGINVKKKNHKCLIKASGENKDKLTKIINKSFNDTPMDGNRAYFNI